MNAPTSGFCTAQESCVDSETSKSGLPGLPLDLDPPAGLRPGKCNWCGARISQARRLRGARCCSDECTRAWKRHMRTVGYAIAELLLTDQLTRHDKPIPAHGRKARRDAFAKLRNEVARLKTHWEEQERLRNANLD